MAAAINAPLWSSPQAFPAPNAQSTVAVLDRSGSAFHVFPSPNHDKSGHASQPRRGLL